MRGGGGGVVSGQAEGSMCRISRLFGPGRVGWKASDGTAVAWESRVGSGRQEVASEEHACLADGIGHESSSAFGRGARQRQWRGEHVAPRGVMVLPCWRGRRGMQRGKRPARLLLSTRLAEREREREDVSSRGTDGGCQGMMYTTRRQGGQGNKAIAKTDWPLPCSTMTKRKQ